MVHCAWGDCSNNDKYNKGNSKRPRKEFVETWWVSWPKNPVVCQKWIKACNRQDFTEVAEITRSKKICSLHFVGNKGPSAKYPDPVPFFYNKVEECNWLTKSRKRKAPAERKVLTDKLSFSNSHQNEESGMDAGDGATAIPGVHCPPANNSADCYVSVKITSEASCQTSLVFEDLMSYSEEELKHPAILRRRFVVDDIKDSAKFYTGLSLVKLMFLFNTVKDKATRMIYWKGESNTVLDEEPVRHQGGTVDSWT